MKRLQRIISYSIVFSLTFSVFSSVFCNSWHYDQNITTLNPTDAKDRLKAAGFIEETFPTFSQEKGSEKKEITGKLRTLFLKRENAIANIVFFHGFLPETKESLAPFLKTAPKTCNLFFVDTNISKNVDKSWQEELSEIGYALELLAKNTNGLPTIIYGCRSGAFFITEALKNFVTHDKNHTERKKLNIKGIILDSMFTSGRQLYQIKSNVKENIKNIKIAEENENVEKSEKQNKKNEPQQNTGLLEKILNWGKKIISFYENSKETLLEHAKQLPFIGPIIGQASEHMHNGKLCPQCILNFITELKIMGWAKNPVKKMQLLSFVMSILKPIFGFNENERNKELINGIETLETFPILIIHAEDDPLSPIANVRAIEQKMIPYNNIFPAIIEKGKVSEQYPHPHLNPELETFYKAALEEFIKLALGVPNLNPNEKAELLPSNSTSSNGKKGSKSIGGGSFRNSWAQKKPKKKKIRTTSSPGKISSYNPNPIPSPSLPSSSSNNPSRSYSSPNGYNNNGYYPRNNSDTSDHYARQPRSDMFGQGPGASAAWAQEQPRKISKNQNPGVTSYDLAHCNLYLYEDPQMQDKPDPLFPPTLQAAKTSLGMPKALSQRTH